MFIENKQDLLFNILKKFYSNKSNLDILLKCVYAKGNISLRLIDHLCTNYAKESPVIYKVNGEMFNLYPMYRSQLKAYSKKRFDPFRRNDRIHLNVGDEKVETTIAQLNFFKWLIENNVLQWLEKNLKTVDDNMNKEKGTKKASSVQQKQLCVVVSFS